MPKQERNLSLKVRLNEFLPQAQSLLSGSLFEMLTENAKTKNDNNANTLSYVSAKLIILHLKLLYSCLYT
jgi:hypothetical protein